MDDRIRLRRAASKATPLFGSRRLLVALGIVAGTAASPALGAEQLCVNTDGSGGCFTSIAAALGAGFRNVEIEVAAGVYPEPLLSIVVRRVTVRGAGAGATVIQGRFDVQNQSTRLVLSDLTVDGPDAGTAIRVGFRARLDLEHVEVTGAETGIEGIGGRSRATIVESRIHSNGAAGIERVAHLRLLRSLVQDNGSYGLLQSGNGAAMVDDCTFSGNADSAIYLYGGSVKLRGSTVVGSSTVDGGAVHVTAGGVLRFETSILTDDAGGTPGLPDLRIDDAARSNGFNLVKDPAVGTLPTGRTAFDVVGVDPLLGPLQDNGGSTLTHAPAPGSPALEAVVPPRFCRRVDQRGVSRDPAPCDIGAVEVP